MNKIGDIPSQCVGYMQVFQVPSFGQVYSLITRHARCPKTVYAVMSCANDCMPRSAALRRADNYRKACCDAAASPSRAPRGALVGRCSPLLRLRLSGGSSQRSHQTGPRTLNASCS